MADNDGILPKPSAVTLKADFNNRLKKAQHEALLGIYFRSSEYTSRTCVSFLA